MLFLFPITVQTSLTNLFDPTLVIMRWSWYYHSYLNSSSVPPGGCFMSHSSVTQARVAWPLITISANKSDNQIVMATWCGHLVFPTQCNQTESGRVGLVVYAVILVCMSIIWIWISTWYTIFLFFFDKGEWQRNINIWSICINNGRNQINMYTICTHN